MIYLLVSYEQKEDAKKLGARWDPNKKLWYAPDDSYTELIDTYEKAEPIVDIGENRNYGYNKLYVDLLPKSSNIILKNTLKDNEFKVLRNLVLKRSLNKCEICEEEKDLEICERFSYNLETNTQKLERILSLCKKCYTTVRVLDKVVCLSHLMEHNNLDKESGIKHIKDAYELWKKRSEIKWKPDLSIINNLKLTKKTAHVTINKLKESPNMTNTTSEIVNQTKKITIHKVFNIKKESCIINDSD